jgi:hypothetical protein
MADLRDDDKLFAASGERTTIGTSEVNIALFRNPSGSTTIVKPKLIVYDNTHTVSSFLRIRVYVDATVTSAGTGVSEVALDVGSGNTPQAEFFTAPTTSANGTLILDLSTLGGAQSQDNKIVFPDGFRLRADHNLLFTALSDGTNRIAHISLLWEED